MKKLSKLKLNQIAKESLAHKQMRQILGGGGGCTCSCYYEGSGGGSSVSDNCTANTSSGYTSRYGETQAGNCNCIEKVYVN